MNETFTSQSGNFLSALQSHVDPRTGQFMVNLPLAELIGNGQLGPELSLGLNYSPLNTTNNGFGTGFSLGVTQFNKRTNQLELSSGESYRIDPGTDNVRHKKLDNFHFAYTNAHDDAEGYTVYWKEGKQEQLTPVGGESFVTSEITSPMGHKLTLLWDWNGQMPLLTRIDDEQSTLCSVTYESVVSMTLWPDTNELYEIVFTLINGDQLNVVSRQISDSESLDWYFDYFFVAETQKQLLSEVRYPTGKTDTVMYSAVQGLKFPEESGISHQLPAVLSLISNPGGGQPTTTTYYEYSQHNFLGYNGNFGNWSADSDYTYTTLTNYTYSSIETVSDSDTTITTYRTYNNYHLQTSEETTRELYVYRIEFTYYAEEGLFIESQPNQFQLLREKTETWMDKKGNYRTQSTLTEFDESGNPIKQLSPDGTETITTWFAAEGEGGCPAEPRGFVRFMKKQAVTPRKTAYHAPTRTTKYKYALLDEDATHIVQDTVSDYADDVLIHRKKFRYNSNGAEYGRIIGITDSKYGNGEHSDPFVSHQDFQTVAKNGVLDQKTTFIGHDKIQTTSRRIQSSFSGLMFSETDTQDVTITYTYDKLGRPLKRSLTPGTDFENTMTWAYAIDDKGPVTTHTDNSGNQVKVYFDGAGRQISIERLDRDRTQSWFEVSSQTYNVFGQVSKVTRSDWRTDTNVRYNYDSTFFYDGWGSASAEKSSHGTKKLKITNPVALTQTAHIQADERYENYLGGTYLTKFDQQSFLPLIEMRLDSSEKEEGRKTYKYDGLGRLRQEKDELDRIIKRSYDVYGRVLTQALPDSSVVTRTYAPHLTGEQVSSISVTGPNPEGRVQTWVLGTQEFDSLGRITKQVVGGRVSSYEYEGASPVASATILPSGDRVVFTYIPELDNAVKSLTAKGVIQTFSYEQRTGQLVVAKESESSVHNAWSESGLLMEEHFSQNERTQKTVSTYTLKGMPLSYTDVTGKQMQYSLDNLGRITRITDEALTVDLKYDPLGRFSERKVSDNLSSANLTTTLTYDDFGRETTRTIKNGHGMVLEVSQTWHKNGLLATRTIVKNSNKIREESYKYDSRNRLIDYNVSGTHLPHDSYGNLMTHQTYNYDVLNNFTSVKTTLLDKKIDTASYFYENQKDPTQLTKVTHTHESYPKNLSLSYDTDGRMIRDEAGRTLTYDVTGRLSEVKANNGQSGSYCYDALDRLITRKANSSGTRELYYRGDELVNEITSSPKTEVRLIKLGHTYLGVRDNSGLTLTSADVNDSLLWSVDTQKNAEGRIHSWSPYGSGKPDSDLPGFNGERIDPVSGTYHLGNGYRAYNPVLMRFNCPDSLSPFGAGGINPYAYCAGDPVNHVDPSGHLSWSSILGIVTGVVALGSAVFTAGASIAAAGGVMAAISSTSATSLIVGGLRIAKDATSLASKVLKDSNPEASATLGWISMATGLAGKGVVKGSQLKGKFKSQSVGKGLMGAKEHNPRNLADVHDATVELQGEKKRGWLSTAKKAKLLKTPVSYLLGKDVEEPLDNQQGVIDKEEIVALSGTQAAETGSNWITRTSVQGLNAESTMVDRSLQEYNFILEDILIMAFSYGPNDQAYRSVLGLDPVKSYVKSM